jgi:hypothetical protein
MMKLSMKSHLSWHKPGKRSLWAGGTLGALLILAACLLGSAPAAAQEASGWSPPVNLSNSETQSSTPSMAVDPAGGVHVAWQEELDDGRSFISYANNTGGSWSPANEILTSPESQVADYPTLAADSQGSLHLVFRGDATLYYSRAFAPLAGTAAGWSPPAALEYVQNYIGRPHLQVDDQDGLHLVYSIITGGNSGIYYMNSSDGGRSWSDPLTVYKNNRANRSVDLPRLAVAPDGALHVAWVETNFPETFPPIGIRYARSNDGGQSWNESISLADGPYDFPGILSSGQGEVHIVYSGTNPDRNKFHRWSADGGRTWSETFRNTEVGGFQGLPSLALDSAGVLHWLTTASVFQVGNDCLYHATRQQEIWKPGEAVLCGVASGQNPWDVAAMAALGNVLYAAVQYPLNSDAQPQGWQNEIYALRLELPSPPYPAKSLPTTTSLLPTSSSPTSPPPIASPSTLQPDLTQPARGASSPLLVIGGGALLALALVVIIVSLAGKNRQ